MPEKENVQEDGWHVRLLYEVLQTSTNKILPSLQEQGKEIPATQLLEEEMVKILSPHELRVLKALFGWDGPVKKKQDIASEIGVQSQTVKQHRANGIIKLSASPRLLKLLVYD